MIELGYCCGMEPRKFLPVPLACNGPRCGGLIPRDSDYLEHIAPKTYVPSFSFHARAIVIPIDGVRALPRLCGLPALLLITSRDAAALVRRDGSGESTVYRLCQTCMTTQQNKDMLEVACEEIGVDGMENVLTYPRASFVAKKNDHMPDEPVSVPSAFVACRVCRRRAVAIALCGLRGLCQP